MFRVFLYYYDKSESYYFRYQTTSTINKSIIYLYQTTSTINKSIIYL